VPTLDARFDETIGGRLNGPATAYYHQSGGYVVINNETGDVVQVQNIFDKDWKTPW